MSKKISIDDIKYVYFDMDGTLLTSSRIPSPRTIEILKKLKEKKIECAIATGRPYYFAQNEIKIVNPNLPVVSCNGALVYDPIKKEIISMSTINKNKTKSIYDILTKNDAVFLVYTKNKMFTFQNIKTNPESKWLNWFYSNNEKFSDEEKANIEKVENYYNFKIEQYDVIKFLIIYSEIPTQKYKTIEESISKIDDVYIVRSQNEVFDIMPSGLSKGNGLQILHDKGIIDLSKTLVFGDAENDISMFKAAMWSVAMGNAQEKTKKIATFITDDNDSDGIANFIDNLIK